MSVTLFVELGAAMIVASTTVPLFNNRARLSNNPRARANIASGQLMGFEQMAKVRNGRLIGDRILAEFQPDEPPHLRVWSARDGNTTLLASARKHHLSEIP
jgi:hypothetical protein